MAENDIYIRTHKDDLNVIEQINCQKELYRDKTNETDTWSQLNIFLQCFEEEKSVNDSYVPYDGRYTRYACSAVNISILL
jgi:hypothetical protein